MTTINFAIAAFFVSGVGLAVLAAALFIKKNAWLKNSYRARGEIVDFKTVRPRESERNEMGATYAPVIKYQLPDGKE